MSDVSIYLVWFTPLLGVRDELTRTLVASNFLLPTEPFSTSFTLERQFCTFSYRHSLLGSATVWHLAVMPFQVLRSTELLSTPITGYLQGLPLHCRHPASLRELFDRCSDHFLSIPFTSTNLLQPLLLHTYIHHGLE